MTTTEPRALTALWKVTVNRLRNLEVILPRRKTFIPGQQWRQQRHERWPRSEKSLSIGYNTWKSFYRRKTETVRIPGQQWRQQRHERWPTSHFTEEKPKLLGCRGWSQLFLLLSNLYLLFKSGRNFQTKFLKTKSIRRTFKWNIRKAITKCLCLVQP